MHDFVGSKKEEAKNTNNNKIRSLEAPESVYKGLLYSDGVTDRGLKIISKLNSTACNAKNLFK
jgi:hypothetical protein